MRSKAVASQLAQTTEELQKLRLQRQELEIKLEQVQIEAKLKVSATQPVMLAAHASTAVVPSLQGYSATSALLLQEEFNHATLQHAQQYGFNMPFVVSLPAQSHTINVDDAESMTAGQYVSIWEVSSTISSRQIFCSELLNFAALLHFYMLKQHHVDCF